MKRLLVYFLIAVNFLVNLPALVYAQEQPSELAQQAVSLKSGFQTYEKGVWSNTTELTRQEGYAAVLDNLHTNKDGVWTEKGHGWELQNANPFNSGASFVEISNQTSRTRGEMIVMQVGDKVYAYDGTTANDITGDTVPAVGHWPTIRSFVNPGGNYCLFCNDQHEPCFTYDGNVAFTYPVPDSGHPLGTPNLGFPCILGGKTYSKPTLCEGYYGRVVYGGFADHPHTILLSTPINGYDFSQGTTEEMGVVTGTPVPLATDAGAIDVPSNLGEVTGFCSLRVGNGSNDQTMLIGCSKGMALLTGSDSTNFAVKELTRAYGVPNNRTWVPLGDNVLFCATDGVRRIANSAYGANVVGTPVSYPVQNLYQRINASATDQMWAVNNRATQELEFWIPIDSDTQCRNALVANYRTSTGQDLAWSTMSSISGACGIYIESATNDGTNYKGVWVGDYNGYLQNWWGGYDPGNGLIGPLDYGGAVIPWKFVSNIIGANSFAQSSSMKKFVIICDGGRQQFYAQAYVYVTNSDGTTRRLALERKYIANYEQYVGETVTAWDENLAGGTTHLHPALFDYAPRGSGRLWFLVLTGGQSYSAFSGDTIDLVGLQIIQQIGGLKQ